MKSPDADILCCYNVINECGVLEWAYIGFETSKAD